MRIMLSTILALLATVVAHAGVKVTDLNWTTEGHNGRFVVKLSAAMTETPDWDVNGGRFAVTIPGAKLDKNTVKNVAGARLAAVNTKRGVLATLTIPNTAISADGISLTVRDGKIEVTTKLNNQNRAPAIVENKPKTETKTATKVMKSDLGESFLKKIEDEVIAKGQTPEKAKVENVVTAKDEVTSAQSAPKRDSSFSFVSYAGKFTAFLGCVLLFFWGVVQLMKKGVLSKSKLGFLNNSQLVSVLSTTYVGPKRSILLVKAHNQAFLVSSSESGMSFISEVKDVPGLVKQTEKEITGANFDDSVDSAEENPNQDLKEKLDIYTSSKAEEKSGVQKDFVRFSDELKKKVKNLKSLQ